MRAVLIAIWALLLLCLMPIIAQAATTVSAVRVWPASEYTRITLEAGQPIVYTMFSMKQPERLVFDLENLRLDSQLLELPERIDPDDPFIARVRVAQNRPGVVRLVLELRGETKPQAFLLKPVGDYAHRLVIDVYPLHSADPLAAFVEQLDDSKLAAAQADTEPTAKARPPQNPASTPDTSRQAGNEIAEAPAERTLGNAAASREPPRKPKAEPDVVRLITVAIDAGHGGEDPGARGRHGTLEKNITLAIARKLKAAIDKQPNMRAVLIRDGDYFVALQDRVAKARKLRADLFVSVHADAYVKPHARGSSVFALSERGATSAAARWLARKENEADLIGGVNLDIADPYVKQVLLDLSQTATISDSIKLARAVLEEIGGINRLHKTRVEQAGFAVLKAPDIPSILVETAFISNPQEEKRLKRADYQEKMAAAILAGIKKFFAENPPHVREKLALAMPVQVLQ